MNIENVKEKYQHLDMEITGTQNFGNNLALFYHENSKVDAVVARKQVPNISMFENPYIIKRASQPYKNYYEKEVHDLDDYKANTPKHDFFEVVQERHSARDFDPKHKISLSELSSLLHYSYGVSKSAAVASDETIKWSFRHVPSAGGLYPLELYVVVINGMMKKGLYHYNASKNALTLIKEGDFTEYLSEYGGATPWITIGDCSCVVITTSVFERQMIKYGERAYRFILMETGFVSQNMSLISQSLGLSSCMLGFYHDDKINALIGINGVGETVQNILVIGKKMPIAKLENKEPI